MLTGQGMPSQEPPFCLCPLDPLAETRCRPLPAAKQTTAGPVRPASCFLCSVSATFRVFLDILSLLRKPFA